MSEFVNNIINEVESLPDHRIYGQVSSIIGLVIEVEGLHRSLSIGDQCRISGANGRRVVCEVVGFRDGRALVMPFGSLDGIGLGSPAEVCSSAPAIFPDRRWLGRVVNAFGEPVDGKGPLPAGPDPYYVLSPPPPAHTRQRVAGKIDLGVRAMNAFLTCCRGQRMGIFSGSGIGKSMLFSMMACHTDAEVNVIGLIGERGREAREFIEDDLGEEGLARSVIVVATSNESPLVRRQAAYTMMAVAEFFRDQGSHVLCMMDSVTRFAMAQREISLSVGEPPASKGYTPSVFSELPRLLERAGPGGPDQGSITGLFTVLVEGDDHNEPVADAVRGILDGHVVLDRAIAERGRYPAINVLRSLSRTMPNCNSNEENTVVERARQLLATYEDMAELIRLGAYRKGTDPKVDEAINYYPGIEGFLNQAKSEKTDLPTCYQMLNQVLGTTAVTTGEEAAPQPADGPAANPGVPSDALPQVDVAPMVHTVPLDVLPEPVPGGGEG